MRSILGAAIAAIVAAAMTATTAHAATATATAEGEILHAGGPTAIGGSYIVVLKKGRSTELGRLMTAHSGRIGHVYSAALHGFEASLNESAARRLAADPAVDFVEQNHVVHLSGTQTNPPSWGLDRVDQATRPLNASYTYPNTASNVRAYVIDTGIRFSHTDFGGRAVSGFDAIDGGTADDCNGHGTHVAGTIGGNAHGVAKAVTLVAVRVLNCGGTGTYAQVIAGVDWVTADHDPGELAVANMSLGGPVDAATDAAVRNSIADGVTYSIAAGNSSVDACTQTPARVAEAITVAATDINDNRASFSNWGTCVDLFAPGVDITSAWYTSDTATNKISGTSMAAPHVAGAAAMVLSANPGFTPQQVRDRLFNTATPNLVVNPNPGTPNRLLFVGGAASGPFITEFVCDSAGGTISCYVAYSGATPPISIRWTWNGAPISAWDNKFSVFANCQVGVSVQIGVRVSDATGNGDSRSGTSPCRRGNP